MVRRGAAYWGFRELLAWLRNQRKSKKRLPKTPVVVGIVRTDEGQRLARALVVYSAPGASHRTMTDGRGRFVVKARVGKGRINVSRRSFHNEIYNLDIEEEKTVLLLEPILHPRGQHVISPRSFLQSSWGPLFGFDD